MHCTIGTLDRKKERRGSSFLLRALVKHKSFIKHYLNDSHSSFGREKLDSLYASGKGGSKKLHNLTRVNYLLRDKAEIMFSL